MSNNTLKENLTSGTHWLRLLYMLLFAVILYVAGLVMGVIVVLQFLFALIGGAPNGNLQQFGDSLALYIYRILQFLTYSRNDKPFPFSDWPSPDHPSGPQNPVGTFDGVHTVEPGAHTVDPAQDDQRKPGEESPRS